MKNVVLKFIFSSFLVLLPVTTFAMHPIFKVDFKLHSFDQAIMNTLGFDNGSVVYFSELGAVTNQENDTNTKFQSIGCYPFYFVRNGQNVDAGYDCQTFFCIGYSTNTPRCIDNDGQPFGGVVEINNRLEDAAKGNVETQELPYTTSGLSLTQDLQAQYQSLLSLDCTPYLVSEYGVIAGDGYDCKEVGQYIPTEEAYSPSYSCRKMWSGSLSAIPTGGLDASIYKYNSINGYLCTLNITQHDIDVRKNILGGTVLSFESSSPQSKIQTNVHNTNSVSNFSDVSNSSYASAEINDLYTKGILQGYSDGTFKPSNIVNRAEFSKMLIDGLHKSEEKAEHNCFPDINSEWFSEYVCAAKRLGWLAGYPNGMFMANNTINRAEAIKILVSSLTNNFSSNAALPSDVSSNAWYAPYVRKAVELGIVSGNTFAPSSNLTRADAAIWIDRAINPPLVEGMSPSENSSSSSSSSSSSKSSEHTSNNGIVSCLQSGPTKTCQCPTHYRPSIDGSECVPL